MKSIFIELFRRALGDRLDRLEGDKDSDTVRVKVSLPKEVFRKIADNMDKDEQYIPGILGDLRVISVSTETDAETIEVKLPRTEAKQIAELSRTEAKQIAELSRTEARKTLVPSKTTKPFKPTGNGNNGSFLQMQVVPDWR